MYIFNVIDQAAFNRILSVVALIGIADIITVMFSVLGIRKTATAVQNKKIEERVIEYGNETQKIPEKVPIKNRINYEFIEKLEGGVLYKAYVPKDTNNSSGITVGSGVDLAYLEKELREKVKDKYSIPVKVFTVKGKEAKKLLKKLGSGFLSKEAIDEINSLKKELVLNKVEKEFHDENKSFLMLPAQAQTVVFSRAWHLGWNLSANCPKFFGFIMRKEWLQATHEIRNFFPDKAQMKLFRKRLNQEADYLAKIYS